MPNTTISTASTKAVTEPRGQRLNKIVSFGLNDMFFSFTKSPWVLFDLAVTGAAFASSAWLSPYTTWSRWNQPLIVCTIVYALTFCIAGLGLGYYDRAKRFDLVSIFRNATFSSLLALLVSLGVVYFVYYSTIGRLTLIFGMLGAFLVTTTIRLILAFLLRLYPYRFTILGQTKSEMVEEIAEFCKRRSRFGTQYQYVPWQQLLGSDNKPSVENLINERIVDIVVTKVALDDPETIEFTIQALQAKFRVIDEIDFYTHLFERLPVDVISKDWFLREGIAQRQIVTIIAKRWLDIVASALALLILSPFILLLALLIKLSSPGPVFFNQTRQGRYCEPFKMYKFRTMKSDLGSLDASGGFTQKSDPRVTWIGRVVRPLHLDELPQLINIFLGQMSIVGPRPEALGFAKQMRAALPLYELRYLARPGLTGHAQINQGYALDSVEDTKRKLSYDLFYMCKHNLWLDLLIIVRTVFFLSRGAR